MVIYNDQIQLEIQECEPRFSVSECLEHSLLNEYLYKERMNSLIEL